jgi:hypothetical protein
MTIRHIMKYVLPLVILSCSLLTSSARGQTFKKKFQSLSKSSCIQCHDADTETGLNLDAIGHDLGDAETFRQWEKIFDRITSGEMPPESEERPNPKQLKTPWPSWKRTCEPAAWRGRSSSAGYRHAA